ncbi:MAG: methyltransferase domain-containing protein [Aggregatilineales bacterium]
MEKIDKGQVNTSAAEVYEEFFVPALFADWSPQMATLANVQSGQNVLDVACGTGILARTLAERVGNTGSVIGLDINEGMLAVARRKAPHIDWKQGTVDALPFDDASFDAVLCQFALMFFEDRQRAIREMLRVLKSGGHLAVAVWDSLENTPGYLAMVDLLKKLFGEETANKLRAPYILGDENQLQQIFDVEGIADIHIKSYAGVARFPSIESWMFTDIKGWVLADVLDDEQYETLLNAAKESMKSFVIADGSVAFSAPAYMISARKA